MKKRVAKTYSIEKIADVYLAALNDDLIKSKTRVWPEGYATGSERLLPEILREKNIFFDEEIIAGSIQMLEDRKYIVETGQVTRYAVLSYLGDKVDVIIESTMTEKDAARLKPKNIDFFSVLKYYKITAPGARFVRLGQVIDVAGKIEREAERRKWKERWLNSAIGAGSAILTMIVKSLFFDK